MDLNTLRSAVTVISLLVFAGIVAWAWSRPRARGFEDAARLPFADEAPRGRGRPGAGADGGRAP